MRRRWIWLGGLALLGVAFLSFVVVIRLLEEPPKEEDNPQLDGVLNAMVAVYAESGPEAALALAPLALPEAEAIAVVFYTQGGASTSELVRSLSELGISAQSVGEDYIVSYVPLQHLATVATLAGVVRIDAMIPMQPFQSSGPTASPSPAVAAHGVQDWWTAGYTGQGVKVGIIDGGFDYYSQAVQAGEVPAPAAVRCYLQQEYAIKYSQALADCGGSAHGTAVAEALLDVAPDVTVYLASIQRTDELKAAVAWMVGEGVEVINLSGGFPWDRLEYHATHIAISPLHTVDYAVQNGITWINAAGNSNLKTWYGAFRPNRTLFGMVQKTPRYWHLFTPPGLLKRREARCSLVELEQGDLLKIQLRWEDKGWFIAERDLDILVFGPQDQKFAGPGMGQKVQKGRIGDIPFEYFIAEAPVAGTYCISIRYNNPPRNLNIPDPTWIQLQVLSKQKKMTPSSAAGSIANPAESDNPGLLAVGATDHATNQTIEPFSSRGPTPDGRVKPDIVGVDAVYSTVYHKLFEGTSQAAPHVAGLAALVIQRFGGSELFDTPAEVANYLRSNAAPRPGVPNNIWGFGLAQLPTAVADGDIDADVEVTPGNENLPPPIPPVADGDIDADVEVTPGNENLPPPFIPPVADGDIDADVEVTPGNENLPPPSIPPVADGDIDADVEVTPGNENLPPPPPIPPEVNCKEILQGINIHSLNDNLETPLHAASSIGDFELVLCLLDANADPDVQNATGETPLHKASAGFGGSASLATVNVLLTYNANPNLQNAAGETALHWVVTAMHGEIGLATEAMLVHGADPHAVNDNGETPLHQAAGGLWHTPSEEAAKAAEFLLAHGADPHAVDDNGETPLHWVGRANRAEVARILLEYSADPDVQNATGETPLHTASMSPDGSMGLATVNVLLTYNANPNLQNAAGETALHWVVTAIHGEIGLATEAMLVHGADPNIRDSAGRTPLHQAAGGDWRTPSEEAAKAAEFLLAHGADPHAVDDNGETPLHWVGRVNRAEVARSLLEYSADPDVQNATGETPLHTASVSPDGSMGLATVNVLLTYNANPNLQNAVGETALHWVVTATHGEIGLATEAMLVHGADPHAVDDNGETPLHWVGHLNRAEIARILLEYSADPDVQNVTGETPLHKASAGFGGTAGLATVNVLLTYNANPNLQNAAGETALHWVVTAMHGEIGLATEAMLVHGADPHAVNDNGETPLHQAAGGLWHTPSEEAAKAAEFLLAHGADPHAVDDNGETPLHWVGRFNRAEIARSLLEYSADPDVQNATGETPLHTASVSPDGSMGLATVNVLLTYNANPNLQNAVGETALHWVVTATHGEIGLATEAMLVHGADPNIRDSTGRTPLHQAAGGSWHTPSEEAAKAAEFLLAHGADPHAVDDNGETPLELAALLGRSEVVRLLQAGVER